MTVLITIRLIAQMLINYSFPMTYVCAAQLYRIDEALAKPTTGFSVKDDARDDSQSENRRAAMPMVQIHCCVRYVRR